MLVKTLLDFVTVAAWIITGVFLPSIVLLALGWFFVKETPYEHKKTGEVFWWFALRSVLPVAWLIARYLL